MSVPILKEIPQTFQTARLLIRAPMPGDGESIHPAILETFDQLKRWMPWVDHPPTVEETEENVRRAHVRFLERSDLCFHLFLKENGEFVGSSGLHRIDWRIPKFEIGYWCRKRYAGKGLITEAVRGLTVLAFDCLGANRLEIRCDERNLKSRKVAERVGFLLEGILRNGDLTPDGQLENTAVYSMLPHEFERIFSSLRGRS